MVYNVPNIITYFRIALIPCLVLVFYLPELSLDMHQKNMWATFLFILAAISDWLDGYLARKLNQSSKFGAFIDPVADKLIVIAALLLLLDLDRVNSIIALIIIGREFAISALREWMAEMGARNSVAVSILGKVKTTAQMSAILLLIYQDPILGLPSIQIGFVFLSISVILTIWSMVDYLLAAWPKLKQEG